LQYLLELGMGDWDCGTPAIAIIPNSASWGDRWLGNECSWTIVQSGVLKPLLSNYFRLLAVLIQYDFFVLEGGVIGGDRGPVQPAKRQCNVCLQKIHGGLSGLGSPRSGSPIVRIHALMSA
jgi:hypothetical protein